MPAAGGQDDARDPASAVLDVLAQAFGVVTERGAPGGGTRQRTWLDTFDWRLNKAGLVLEYSRAKRGGRLLLSRDDLPQAEQPITGWQPRRPRLAGDLPAGPVRDQIRQARYGAPATRQPGGPGADIPEAVSQTASIGRHHSAAP